MNPEQQRIAIAEACGWTAKEDKDGLWRAVDPSGNMTYTVWVSEMNVWSAGIPDYLNDLNAMHEAEKALRDWHKYVCMVAKVIVGDTRPKASGNHYRVASSVLIHATAAQRAEAFLRTIGKWEDGK